MVIVANGRASSYANATRISAASVRASDRAARAVRNECRFWRGTDRMRDQLERSGCRAADRGAATVLQSSPAAHCVHELPAARAREPFPCQPVSLATETI